MDMRYFRRVQGMMQLHKAIDARKYSDSTEGRRRTRYGI